MNPKCSHPMPAALASGPASLARPASRRGRQSCRRCDSAAPPARPQPARRAHRSRSSSTRRRPCCCSRPPVRRCGHVVRPARPSERDVVVGLEPGGGSGFGERLALSLRPDERNLLGDDPDGAALLAVLLPPFLLQASTDADLFTLALVLRHELGGLAERLAVIERCHVFAVVYGDAELRDLRAAAGHDP